MRLRAGQSRSGRQVAGNDRWSGRLISSRSRLITTCTGGLKAKGKRHLARDITIKRIMGEGSFGQVFEGLISTPTGDERIVLKRTKKKKPGAEEMCEMEHVLNVYASRVCRKSVAKFMGYCGVSQEEAIGDLTPGTWLVWQFQGDKTLASYMRRRDTLSALAEDLDVPEEHVPRTVLKQILLNLKGLHSAGLVHRDVKPSNLVLATEEKQFKFIDLGACADLRLGTNYVPEESILDPIYCPPEQYVLPTDAPQLSKTAFSMAISPVLWSKHKPDRFDVYSAGLIFLQLAVPTLRSDRAIKGFAAGFERYGCDLQKWRDGSTLLPKQTQILDDHDGAGWDLLGRMLRQRRVEEDGEGNVSFVDTENGELRISVGEALGHVFFKVTEHSEQKPLISFWRRTTRKLFDLEGQILDKVVETEQQTTTVKKVKSKVESGEATQQELEKEEKKLSKLEESLKSVQNEFVQLAKTASEKFGTIQLLPDTEDGGPSKSFFGGFFKSFGRRGSAERSPDDKLRGPENLIYAGLKFTGLAARVAGDLAKSIKSDAAKLLAEIEEENSTKRQRELRDRQFLEMLKASGMEADAKYEEIEKRVRGLEPYKVVDPRRRRLLFDAYLRALTERKSRVAQQAEEKLAILFSQRGVNAASDFEEISESLATNEIFTAVDDLETRRRIFDQVVSADLEKRAAKATIQSAESEFRILLRETEPPIIGETSWARVKRQLFHEERYQAIPEDRRAPLFEEYRQIVRDIEEEEEETRLAELERLKQKAASETAAAEKRLSELMKQRSALKQDYERMQENLQRVEQKLNPSVQSTPDGGKLYTFDRDEHDSTTAAESNGSS